mgnify:FL=1
MSDNSAGDKEGNAIMSLLDQKLLDVLCCPICKSPLVYKKAENELICRADRLAFPIREGIPVMLEEEARQIRGDEEV